MALNAGDIIKDRYEIREQVGQGAFSNVYRAYDCTLRDDVALKVFNPESAANFGDLSTIRKRFVQEAQITRKLEHPHIIHIHDLDPSDQLSFIVMPFLPNTLADQLEQLTVSEAVQAMLQICDGLAYAHRRQVVHCDIKPNNILFDKSGQVKITDFGIAHVPHGGDATGSLTTQMFGAGTILYMSPEQLEGERTDPRIDVYALGALLHQMLTQGRYYLDFDLSGTTKARAENIARIFKENPTRVHLKHVPKALTDITLRALSKHPQDRFGDAGKMLEAIRAYQGLVSPVSPARLETTMPIGAQKRPPRPANWIFVLAGIVLIGGAASLLMPRVFPPPAGVTATNSPTSIPSRTATLTSVAPTVSTLTATRALPSPTFTALPSGTSTLAPTRIPIRAQTATPMPRPAACPGNQVWNGRQCECPPDSQWIPGAQWCTEMSKGGDGGGWRP